MSTNASTERNSAKVAHGFDERYFSELARIEDESYWFRARNALILWAINLYSSEMAEFLEIGCGTGYVLRAIRRAFPNANLTGTELFPEAFQFARTRIPTANFIAVDGKHMSISNQFDAIGAFDVLEHIDDDLTCIRNIHNALRPDGFFFATVPQHSWLWSPSDVQWCHCRRYEPGELEEKLSRTGFKIVWTTSFMFLLLPLMAIARYTQRWHGDKDFDSFSQLKAPTAISWLLEAILFVEFLAIRLGANFPVGGSRLVIARRFAKPEPKGGADIESRA